MITPVHINTSIASLSNTGSTSTDGDNKSKDSDDENDDDEDDDEDDADGFRRGSREQYSLQQFGFHGIEHIAHKADILRLILLIKYGGYYLDLDMVSLKPLPRSILDHRCPSDRPSETTRGGGGVVGEGVVGGGVVGGGIGSRVHETATVVLAIEGSDGMGNAAMIACPGASFLRRWLDYYRSFDAKVEQ
jgi:hypothetical protein